MTILDIFRILILVTGGLYLIYLVVSTLIEIYQDEINPGAFCRLGIHFKYKYANYRITLSVDDGSSLMTSGGIAVRILSHGEYMLDEKCNGCKARWINEQQVYDMNGEIID